ncbi:hypothetical protein FLX27_30020 [Agrobacterium tumefaciens]|nr:hypothetical protein [Agrobacterium tumefaciens]TQN55368.1 hypothetical protein FLX27_30020 [Agrobacterium tumefaciens]
MKLVLGHFEAIRKARHQAEVARPAVTDHEFWNNDYTDDMIAIIRDPSFMTKGGFWTFPLTHEDRELIVAYLLRCREIDEQDRAARARIAA